MICMFQVIHYCLLMYLRILETNVMKYMNYILLISYLHLDLHGRRVCMTEVKLELLTKSEIRGGISHAIHRYAKANISIQKIMIKKKSHHVLNI